MKRRSMGQRGNRDNKNVLKRLTPQIPVILITFYVMLRLRLSSLSQDRGYGLRLFVQEIS